MYTQQTTITILGQVIPVWQVVQNNKPSFQKVFETENQAEDFIKNLTEQQFINVGEIVWKQYKNATNAIK